jgi:pyruvate kinase
MEEFRRTKIVATLGPASEDVDTLRQLIEAGVDVVRLNFSHGNHEEKARAIANVREVEKAVGRPVAILQDIQGPKIRVGPIPDGPIHLTVGAQIDIHGDGREGNSLEISTTYPDLAREVDRGESIFLDDGAIELRVVDTRDRVLRCEVVIGGELTSAKGVNLPGARLSAPAVTDKDIEDLRFGLKAGVDYVALSFVRSPHDADEARRVMREVGVTVPLLAKIEKREAVDRLASVLRAFDGAMVARGDLGVELRPEKVPGVQKQIIAQSLSYGRPVITATQMLESMTQNRRPTRAEASDVANAVFDGTHAVMLSGETAIGKHPVEAVRAMHRIAVEAEHVETPPVATDTDGRSTTRAFCIAAAQLAEEVEAAALIAFTRSGQTARMLSSLQPARPIIALCETQEMARGLCLWRGVVPVVIGPPLAGESSPVRMERELAERRLLPAGSSVVALGAALGSRAGVTNFIRLLKV